MAYAPDDTTFDIEFYNGYGPAPTGMDSEGPGVLAWSEERVYFPVEYDGAEWLASAPRHPTEAAQGPVGGQTIDEEVLDA